MATDQRSAFAAEIARLVNKHKILGEAEATTKSGHTVHITGISARHVGAIVITEPHGREVRRADGWKIGETTEVAGFLWDELEKARARAADRKRLEGLKSVSITSVDAIGSAADKETSRYHLTPEQLVQLRAQAEQMAAANATATAAE
ncbi:hypothetical protein [Streptomyces lydicus]|uniref:hypothetical protein n=1 Tax=Streptomyces lydicus TaxID=47763 RepID=UPI001010B997|nr:hypothetical protein [Streptomyces lydicus]MCZ1012001.1 hypothetical protein [Streptomyces lydicus]